MRNIKLVIEYDGTRYDGWQKQDNTPNTIQGKLTDIITDICGGETELIGSGRTDAGVHAYSQTANFKTESAIDISGFKDEINKRLGNDMCVKQVMEVDNRFHARYNAKSKKYMYRIWNHADINVFERRYSFHVAETLSLDKIKAAAKLLTGEHDFKGFSADKRKVKSTVRTIHSIELFLKAGMLEIVYHGDSFLYNMVRILTGTLVEIGAGKMPLSVIDYIFESKDRTKAGFTAPPQGLFLKEVIYE